MLRLYSYFRSSSAYRVRIALNLKGLPYEVVPVHLLRAGGEQHQPQFVHRNPAELLPVLEDAALQVSQSVAIIEYLEEIHPTPPLLPRDPASRAWIRALALDVACDIQPLNNLRVLQYLKSNCALADAARTTWSHEWMKRGFAAVEARLSARHTADYCYGTGPTLADCCLVPQVFNALRVNLPLQAFPNIVRIYENCMQSEPFQKAAPGSQIDAE